MFLLTFNNNVFEVKSKIEENEYYKTIKDEGIGLPANFKEIFDYDYRMYISPDLPIDRSFSDLLRLAANSDGFDNCTGTEPSDTVSEKSSCFSYQKEVENFATTSDIDYSDGLKNVIKTRFNISSKYVNMDSNYTVAGE